jgi:hypothetical protein
MKILNYLIIIQKTKIQINKWFHLFSINTNGKIIGRKDKKLKLLEINIKNMILMTNLQLFLKKILLQIAIIKINHHKEEDSIYLK